ncbi:antizyme inhibitor 1-like [Periophthalmus magnuspinnatus]|uniref:antizyme inhibitor 1-like n=1 Tax=Periophthalmus magnuspinnatus TaxID=409849 RepID=UPI00145C0550|nr:antizyme inhibitor 1-like [Periophthalmus magnuspinnatus]XP_055083585.1 antizyme inhibitor 1-like [Periophthalmus magnuspinnatus]XP_055083586.1 antizyme inhibitor 1-like [Periophthalmus magnuspinnatus]XP_055083587.1 antizyme inhibitor 1-like [Periophthalmus magnuspinnatus]XP_055083588.1 antizyme inhibitor 1-like [Periophthalmus magnuspinnatus]
MKGISEEPQYSIGLLEGGTALCDVIDNHIHEQSLSKKTAFFVADLGVLVRQHVLWQTHMTQIRPFYPVRCNSSPAIIEVLAALGTGFLCANKSELELVQSRGIPPEDIIYSGACKQVSQIKYAAKNGIDLLICDNEAELRKIARSHPNAKLLLQVSSETSYQDEMSMAFGCSLKDCRHLLESAKELGVQVVGVRCHISSTYDDDVYIHAISDARCVFDMGEDIGFNMKILDIGGVCSSIQLDKIKNAVMAMVELYFPPSSGVSLIAEPGSYFVSSAFTLAVNIISRELVARDQQDHDDPSPNDEPAFKYYLSEGVYGPFAGKLAETLITAPSVHKITTLDAPVFCSTLWGPSGDDMDQIVEHCLLPELNVGDWLLFTNAGAYSLGQPVCTEPHDSLTPPVFYVICSREWFEMQGNGVTQETTLKNLIPYFLNSCQTAAAFSVPA